MVWPYVSAAGKAFEAVVADDYEATDVVVPKFETEAVAVYVD